MEVVGLTDIDADERVGEVRLWQRLLDFLAGESASRTAAFGCRRNVGRVRDGKDTCRVSDLGTFVPTFENVPREATAAGGVSESVWQVMGWDLSICHTTPIRCRRRFVRDTQPDWLRAGYS
jgi:hypothetical protein